MLSRQVSFFLLFLLICSAIGHRCYDCDSTSDCRFPRRVDCCDDDRGGCASCVKIIERSGNIRKGCLSDSTGQPFVRTTDRCWTDDYGKYICACYGELCNSAAHMTMGLILTVGALWMVGRLI